MTTFDPFANSQEPRILLRDEFYCSIVVGRYGKRHLLFGNELVEAIKKAPKREPRPPKIQVILKQAYEFKERLDKTPDLTRDALAKQAGFSPSYLTRVLNLLNLAPSIQKYILALPPSVRMGPLTEHSLKPLAKNRDWDFQIKEFNRLLS